MIKFILKKWSLILDIALVVGAILFFTFWDPFRMFTKTQSRATANMVSSIRDIGQLVTAEYYGEVISSWKEFKLTEYPVDTIGIYAKEAYVEIKSACLKDNASQNNIRNRVRNLDIYKDYSDSKLYVKMIAFLADNHLNKPLRKIYNEKDETLKKNIEEDVLQKLYKEAQRKKEKIRKKYKNDNAAYQVALTDYIDEEPEFLNNFYSFYSQITRQTLERRKNKKKNIVFIGRGWVKAGFDFGQLNENNFTYDKSTKTMHMYGMEPVILNYDINPWFIPERKVKGFDLVDYSGDVNFEDAKNVKKQCKEKLLAQAREADIINAALKNGEEALVNFFSIVLDEPELKVQLYTDPYNHHYAVIAADQLIDHKESLFIKKLYDSELERIKTLSKEMQKTNYRQLCIFIEDLKKLHFINSKYKFNYYSMLASEILQDTFHISIKDINSLLSYRDTLNVDSSGNKKELYTNITRKEPCWFATGNFYVEFDHTIDLIKDEFLTSDSLYVDSTDNPKFKKSFGTMKFNNREILTWDTLLIATSDTLLQYYFKDAITNNKVYLNDLKYNPYYSSIDSMPYFFRNDSTITIYNNDLLKQHGEIIKKVMIVDESLKKYDKQMKPINKLTTFVHGVRERLKN